MLRVLQERTFEPLGSSNTVKINVRVISATNRDLAIMANTGDFREDLYYRINLLNIHIPPLRDRRSDIPALVKHFIRSIADLYDADIPYIDEDTFRWLSQQEYKGKFRMSLKYKYILFIAIIHIVLILVVYQLLLDNKWLFLGCEILVAFSLILSYQLYKEFIKPIQKLSNVNPAAAKILDIKDSWIEKSLDFYSSELIPRIQKIPNDSPTLIEVNGIDKYKVQINEVVHQGFKRKFILIDDLSTEMLKTQKEAFGKIIRMMAHEVNNSMGAVNSIIDTVVEYGFDDNDDPALKESLEIAKERNVGLGKFMANYASILRLPEPQMQKMDLAAMLKKSGQLYIPKAKELDSDSSRWRYQNQLY